MQLDETLIAAQNEREIIGHIILDGQEALSQCVRLKPEMFGVVAYGTLFRRLSQLLDEHETVDLLMIWNELERRGESNCVGGGLAELCDLTNGLARNFVVTYHVDRVIALWKGRRGAEECNAFIQRVAARDDVDDALSRLQGSALDILGEHGKEDDPHVSSYLVEVLDRWKNPEDQATFPYGLPVLDNITGGMFPGEVTVIGARNGVGKSSLMVQALAACSRAGIAVHAFSLEMTRQALLHRIWSIEADVPLRIFRFPNEATPQQKRGVTDAAMRVGT